MTIILTGGTGLIGRSLIKKLQDNYTLHLLVRTPVQNLPSSCKQFIWENSSQPPPQDAFPQDQKYAVIHLAGSSIFKWPWTSQKKEEIYNSRIESTKKLANLIQTLPHKPETFICANAIGIYGNQYSKQITEDWSFKDQGLFLQKVCKNWEQETLVLKNHCRVLILRLGIVLSCNGGFLKEQLKQSKLLVPFFLSQKSFWISWIHIEDLTNLITSSLSQIQREGIYNATAPEPFTMNVFLKKIAAYLNKKYLRYPLPLFLVKLLAGEMAKNILTSSRVTSQKLQQEEFIFKYKNINEALKDLLK